MPVCSVGEGVLGLTDSSQHSAPVIYNQYFYVYFFRCRLSIRNFSFFPNCFLIFFFKKKKKKLAPGRGAGLRPGGAKPPLAPPLATCLLPTSGVTLPPGSNTADNARADVSARSIWNRLERAFLDVRVYHAQVPSNRNLKTIPRM